MIRSLVLLVLLAAALGADTMTPRHYRQICAFVTGYNTVVEQTDETPCIAATGANICGRGDVVACPRNIRLGTLVEIGVSGTSVRIVQLENSTRDLISAATRICTVHTRSQGGPR